jgi:hypothetical protein
MSAEVATISVEFPTVIEACPIKTDSFLQEQLVCLYFYLTRAKGDKKLSVLREKLGNVLDIFKQNLGSNPGIMVYFKLFYRMVGQTRDLLYGKGEHDLTYMMLWEWYKRYPTLAIYATYRLVLDGFGSWRDIKYLCDYLRSYGGAKSVGFIDICVSLMNQQLRTDLETWKFSINARSRNHISNVAKWIPREHKKFDWLYELLAMDWAKTEFPYIMATTHCSYDSFLAAKSKCKRLYRKQISLLNKALDTTQIKQCSRQREAIIPANVSTRTLMTQPGLVFSDDLCSHNFKKYFDKKFSDFDTGKVGSGSPTIFPTLFYFVKTALMILKDDSPNDYRLDLLDKQWKVLSKSISNKKLENLLPILDMSYSIQKDDAESLYTAIGLAILIAERSTFGKRVLVIDHTPTWVNLEECPTFFSMVTEINSATEESRFTIPDFNKGIDMIMIAIASYNIDDPNRSKHLIKDIENLRLLIISNFDGFIGESNVYSRCIGTSETVGKSETTATSPSQFILWNVGTQNIEDIHLPGTIHQTNLIFMSGSSPHLIRDISHKRDYAMTPYRMVCSILNSDRYSCFENYIDRVII